jgi:hypothetical protein
LTDGKKHGGEGFIVLPGAIDAQVDDRRQLGQEARALAKRFEFHVL